MAELVRTAPQITKKRRKKEEVGISNFDQMNWGVRITDKWWGLHRYRFRLLLLSLSIYIAERQSMGRKQSIRSKAAHFVSDLTTVLLNPISDKPSKPQTQQPRSPSPVSVSIFSIFWLENLSGFWFLFRFVIKFGCFSLSWVNFFLGLGHCLSSHNMFFMFCQLNGLSGHFLFLVFCCSW